MKSVEEAYAIIKQCVVDAKAAGWMIVPGTWSDPEHKRCCALGACAVGEVQDTFFALELAIRTRVGADFPMWSFADGFDHPDTVWVAGRPDDRRPYYELGQRIRKENDNEKGV